jgi:signal transduction histidine kinase
MLDEVRLRQVMLNVVGNAIKFTDAGKVVVSMRGEARSGSKLDLVLEVQDSGLGIPAEEMDSIFEAFRQRRGQSLERYGGSGLGLSITKRLVEMMRGEIRIESQVGVGTTFRISFRDVAVVARSSHECA